MRSVIAGSSCDKHRFIIYIVVWVVMPKVSVRPPVDVTPEELFSDVGLKCYKHDDWSKLIDNPLARNPGVYTIVLELKKKTPRISDQFLKQWIRKAQDLGYNNERPNNASVNEDFIRLVKDHLKGFWLPGNIILYIGQTGKGNSTVRGRVKAYYDHKLGDRGSHKGGHWIKTLEDWKECKVYWSPTKSVEEARLKEILLLEEFQQHNSKGLIPFANLISATGKRKQNGNRITKPYARKK